MTSLIRGSVLALVFAWTLAAQDDKKPIPAGERLTQLRKQSDEIEATFLKELRADRSDAGTSKANQKYRDARTEWRKEALAALRVSGELPEAFAVIEAVLSGSHVETVEMTDLLRKHHKANPDMGKLFHGMVQDRQGHGRAFVEEMATTSLVPAVRGQAAFALGWQAKWRIAMDGEESLGFEKKLTEVECQKMQARAEKYLTLAATYKDAPMARGTGTIAAHATAELEGLKNLTNLRVGKIAPDIVGEATDGTKFKLSDSRGKVTVLVFWASWCGPCMRMVPHEKKLAERLKDQPFALVGINGDESVDKALSAAKSSGMTWPSFWDAAERPDGPITRAWNVHAWPTIYVLDAKGVIRYVGHDDDKLDSLVDELLQELAKK